MRTYNQIGVSDAFHPLSHHQNDPDKLDRLAKIQTYHTEMFARFVKRLGTIARRRWQSARSLDHSVRQQHEQQRHCTTTIRCRVRCSGAAMAS